MRQQNRANAQWSDSGNAVLGVSTHSGSASLAASRERSGLSTPPANPWIAEHPDIFPEGVPPSTMGDSGTRDSHFRRTIVCDGACLQSGACICSGFVKSVAKY